MFRHSPLIPVELRRLKRALCLRVGCAVQLAVRSLPTARKLLTAAPADADGDGLTIQEYAKKFDIPTAEVWRQLRRGELVGRTEHGRLIIYTTPATAPAVPVRSGAETVPEATIEHGDLAVREDGDGRLLPTAIFARWRRD